jgi:hypothetical protein
MARKRNYSQTLFLGGEQNVTEMENKMLPVSGKNVTLIIIYKNI